MRRLKAFVERSKFARGIVEAASVTLFPILLATSTLWVYSYVELATLRGNLGHYQISAKTGFGQLKLTVYDARHTNAGMEYGWYAGAATLHQGVVQSIQDQRKKGQFEFDLGRRQARPVFIRTPLAAVVIPIFLMFVGVRSVSSRFTVRSLFGMLTISAVMLGAIVSISR